MENAAVDISTWSMRVMLDLMVYSREQTPQSSAQQYNIISGVDGSRERGFIGIEVCEDMRKDRWGLARGRKLDGRFL